MHRCTQARQSCKCQDDFFCALRRCASVHYCRWHLPWVHVPQSAGHRAVCVDKPSAEASNPVERRGGKPAVHFFLCVVKKGPNCPAGWIGGRTGHDLKAAAEREIRCMVTVGQVRRTGMHRWAPSIEKICSILGRHHVLRNLWKHEASVLSVCRLATNTWGLPIQRGPRVQRWGANELTMGRPRRCIGLLLRWQRGRCCRPCCLGATVCRYEWLA